MDRDSSVGITTGYWLDGPGIESRWGRAFPHLSRPALGTTSLLYNGYRVIPGVKSGRGVTLTPHSLLMPWSRKSRAIPLLPLWAVQPVQSLSACTRVHFTSYFFFFLNIWRIFNSEVSEEQLQIIFVLAFVTSPVTVPFLSFNCSINP